MKFFTARILKLAFLNLIFFNTVAQQVQTSAIPDFSPALNPSESQIIHAITSAEVQAQSVLVAGEINRDWWLKTGIYTAAIISAGCLIYNKRESLKAWWQKDSSSTIEFNAKQDHEKVATMWHSYTANQAAINQRDTASKTFLSQLKTGAIGTAGLAVVGVVAEPIILPVINKTVKPAFKFMSTRDLDYYLYQTGFHDQLTSLKDFMQELGDHQIDNGVVIDLKPEIRLKLVNLRAAMITVLSYLEYAQNDLATGISASQASEINQKLKTLRAIAVKIQADCNDVLRTVLEALGNLKSQADQELLGAKIYKLHVTLNRQLKEFATKV